MSPPPFFVMALQDIVASIIFALPFLFLEKLIQQFPIAISTFFNSIIFLELLPYQC